MGAVSATVALLLTLYSVGLAHSGLIASEPAADSRLTESPRRVRLVFSEPIEPRLGQISIVGSAGAPIRLVAAGDPRDVRALVAPVELLPAGAYRVVWRIVSADGHPVEGSYVFSIAATEAVVVGEPSPPPPPPPPAAAGTDSWGPALAGAPLGPAALRGVALGCLMVLCGVLFFLGFPAVTGAVPDRVARLPLRLSILAPALLGAHLLAWAVNVSPEHRLDSSNLLAALASSVGRVELSRLGLALLALWAVALARRPRLAFGFTVAALALSGYTGHSAAIASLWTAPARALHLLAGSAWLGGLLWLLLLDRTDRSRFLSETSRVSSIALVSVAIVTTSGVVQARFFLPTLMDFVRSSYGVISLTKVAGVAGLVAFGAYHRFRVMPRLATSDVAGPFQTSLRREVALMAALVLLGGLLAYVPPPADPKLPATPASQP